MSGVVTIVTSRFRTTSLPAYLAAMSTSTGRPDRINPRLSFHDYASAGTYFVTICTRHRAPLFGRILDGAMHLSQAGRIFADCWLQLPHHFPDLELDAFVIMPDHIHGILTITRHQRNRHDMTRRECDIPGSLGVIIRSLKSATTREINRTRGLPGSIWQRGYNERIVRSHASLERIRRYIANNPATWHRDRMDTRKGSAC